MSEGYDEEYEVEIDEEEEPSNLRKAARRGSKAARENELLRKKLAFYEAGIPMNDPKMKYFINGYDGEISAEAIKMAALEAGFIGEPAPSQQESSVNQEVFSAQQRVMDASRGAAIVNNSEANAMAMLEQAMEEGGVEAMLDMAQQFGMQIGEVE